MMRKPVPKKPQLPQVPEFTLEGVSSVLEARAVYKDQSKLLEWVKSQIVRCPPPLLPSSVPPMMIVMLRNHAQSAVLVPYAPISQLPQLNERIDEAFLGEMLAFPAFLKQPRSALLCLHYVLCYRHKLLTTHLPAPFTDELRRRHFDADKMGRDYSEEFYAQLSIRFMLTMMDHQDERGGGHEYQWLKPALIQAVSVLFPEELPTEEAVIYGIGDEVRASLERFDPDADSSCFFHELSILEQCLCYKELASQLSLDWRSFFDNRVAVEKAKWMWHRLEALVPRRLYESVLQVWFSSSPHSAVGEGGESIKHDVVVAEMPTVLFRVDERLFLSPLHFWCWLRVLNYYMTASTNGEHLKLLGMSRSASEEDRKETGDLMFAFNSAKNMTVVCLLIELAGNAEEKGVPEVRQLACDQIHRMFIEEPMLPKLVHYHGYPLKLVPIMVKHVPSTHVLIPSIDELLTYDDVERRVFGIHLMAHLIDKYRTPLAFAGVGFVGEMLDTMLAKCGLDEDVMRLIGESFPALLLMMRVSAMDARLLLSTIQRVEKMLKCRLAIYPSWSQAKESKEKTMLDEIAKLLEEGTKIVKEHSSR